MFNRIFGKKTITRREFLKNLFGENKHVMNQLNCPYLDWAMPLDDVYIVAKVGAYCKVEKSSSLMDAFNRLEKNQGQESYLVSKSLCIRYSTLGNIEFDMRVQNRRYFIMKDNTGKYTVDVGTAKALAPIFSNVIAGTRTLKDGRTSLVMLDLKTNADVEVVINHDNTISIDGQVMQPDHPNAKMVAVLINDAMEALEEYDEPDIDTSDIVRALKIAFTDPIY